MVTETQTHSCRKCGSQNIVLNGRNGYDNQQYLCNRLPNVPRSQVERSAL
jgi:hypothetical protein